LVELQHWLPYLNIQTKPPGSLPAVRL